MIVDDSYVNNTVLILAIFHVLFIWTNVKLQSFHSPLLKISIRSLYVVWHILHTKYGMAKPSSQLEKVSKSTKSYLYFGTNSSVIYWYWSLVLPASLDDKGSMATNFSLILSDFLFETPCLLVSARAIVLKQNEHETIISFKEDFSMKWLVHRDQIKFVKIQGSS